MIIKIIKIMKFYMNKKSRKNHAIINNKTHHKNRLF